MKVINKKQKRGNFLHFFISKSFIINSHQKGFSTFIIETNIDLKLFWEKWRPFLEFNNFYCCFFINLNLSFLLVVLKSLHFITIYFVTYKVQNCWKLDIMIFIFFCFILFLHYYYLVFFHNFFLAITTQKIFQIY